MLRCLRVTCSIDGCGQRAVCRVWFDEHVVMETDDCIIWPFGHNGAGYGAMKWNGKMRATHNVAAEIRIGPKPSVDHVACHTCDTPRCINYRHLYWGTRSDNMRDWVARQKT